MSPNFGRLIEMTAIAAAAVYFVYESSTSAEASLQDVSSVGGDDKDDTVTLNQDSFEPAPARPKGVRLVDSPKLLHLPGTL